MHTRTSSYSHSSNTPKRKRLEEEEENDPTPTKKMRLHERRPLMKLSSCPNMMEPLKIEASDNFLKESDSQLSSASSNKSFMSDSPMNMFVNPKRVSRQNSLKNLSRESYNKKYKAKHDLSKLRKLRFMCESNDIEKFSFDTQSHVVDDRSQCDSDKSSISDSIFTVSDCSSTQGGYDSESASEICDSIRGSKFLNAFDIEIKEKSYDCDTSMEINESFKMEENESFRIEKIDMSIDYEDESFKISDMSFEEGSDVIPTLDSKQSLSSFANLRDVNYINKSPSPSKKVNPYQPRKLYGGPSQSDLYRLVQTRSTHSTQSTQSTSLSTLSQSHSIQISIEDENGNESKVMKATFKSSESIILNSSSNNSNNNEIPQQYNFPRPNFQIKNVEIFDENCISPGSLCSPRPFELRYPVLSNPDFTDSLNMISPETMTSILKNKPKNLFIIDCRFPHEYNGGHIEGAKNINDPSEIKKLFFDKLLPSDTVIIFHCEFSQKRGPKMYRCLRSIDRELHLSSYPYVHYKDIYVLNGGYKAFYEYKESHKFCQPRSYVCMSQPEYEDELKEHYRCYKQYWQNWDMCKMQSTSITSSISTTTSATTTSTITKATITRSSQKPYKHSKPLFI